jgi:hypothetical protein
MNSREAFQILQSHDRSNQRKKGMLREVERLLMPARNDSLLFDTWRGLDLVAAALRRSCLIRNIWAIL